LTLVLILAFCPCSCRITKPLTFADCVGDELPLGWEVVYDQQVGVYYIDHINSKFSSLVLLLNVIFNTSSHFCLTIAVY